MRKQIRVYDTDLIILNPQLCFQAAIATRHNMLILIPKNETNINEELEDSVSQLLSELDSEIGASIVGGEIRVASRKMKGQKIKPCSTHQASMLLRCYPHVAIAPTTQIAITLRAAVVDIILYWEANMVVDANITP